MPPLAASDDTLTTSALPCSAPAAVSIGNDARMVRNIARRSTSRWRSSISVGICASGTPPPPYAAALTSASIRPCAASCAATIRAIASSSPTSPRRRLDLDALAAQLGGRRRELRLVASRRA